MKINKSQVKKTMKKYVEDCRDPNTGEINYTLLAEQTANELNCYIDQVHYEIPEELFEMAMDFL